MPVERINTGSKDIDELLEGGYEKDIITTIYGPSGSGKTNLVLICAVEMSRSGKKVIYIDTEGGFSVSRLEQLSEDQKVGDNFLFLRPVSFDEQKKSFQKLNKIVDEKIGLIVVDTIAMLYRVELGKSEEVYEINRELGKQISWLTEIARKKKIPILITNQVYSGFEDKEQVKMVGGDILRYASKCIIELKNLENKKQLILKKHRSIPEGKRMNFRIIQKGIERIPECT